MGDMSQFDADLAKSSIRGQCEPPRVSWRPVGLSQAAVAA